MLDLVLRQPVLLMLAPETLRAKISGLQALLGGADYQIAAMLLAKQPGLALHTREVLAAKFDALCAAAGLAPAKVRVAVLSARVCAKGAAAAARPCACLGFWLSSCGPTPCPHAAPCTPLTPFTTPPLPRRCPSCC